MDAEMSTEEEVKAVSEDPTPCQTATDLPPARIEVSEPDSKDLSNPTVEPTDLPKAEPEVTADANPAEIAEYTKEEAATKEPCVEVIAEVDSEEVAKQAPPVDSGLFELANSKTENGEVHRSTTPELEVHPATVPGSSTETVSVEPTPLPTPISNLDHKETASVHALESEDSHSKISASGLIRPIRQENDLPSEPSVLISAMNPSIEAMIVNACDCKEGDGDYSLPCSDSELSIKSDSDTKEEKTTLKKSGRPLRDSPRKLGSELPTAIVPSAAEGKVRTPSPLKHLGINEVADSNQKDEAIHPAVASNDGELHRVESFMIDETTIIDPTPTDSEPKSVGKANLNFHNAFVQSLQTDREDSNAAFDENDDSMAAMDETTNDDTFGVDMMDNSISSVQDQPPDSLVDQKKDVELVDAKKKGKKSKVVKPRPPPPAKKKKVELLAQDDESRGSITSNTPSIRRNRSDIALLGESRCEPVTASSITEYVWPPYDPRAENWVLQEHISEYMDLKSFKRRYPKIWRRPVEPVERDNLIENGIVTEKQCDLGLTALRVTEVLDILYNDFPDKYEEYQRAQRERREALRRKARTETLGANVDVRAVALRDVTSWNATFNKERKDKRACAFDLQTFQIHRKVKPIEIIERDEPCNMYPVALLPGQYQDSVKYFTPAELKSMPLSSVVAAPPPEALDDGSQSDSDESSSSDDSSSSSSSDDTQNDETASDVEPEDTYQRPGVACKVCTLERKLTRDMKTVPMIHCTKCDKSVHLTCVGLTMDMYARVRDHNGWMCTACRVCVVCKDQFRLDANNEQRFANCGYCDRNYHLKCCGLKRRPDGRWHCQECAKCTSCGTTKPTEENEPGTWHHETRRLADGTRVYFMTFCVRCLRLWKRGRVCPVCHKCLIPPIKSHEVIDCCSCQRKIHTECVKHLSDIEKRHYNCPKCILKGKRGPVFLPKFGSFGGFGK